MSKFQNPDLKEQLTTFADVLTRAGECPVVWIDTNKKGLIRKANKIWCELRLRVVRTVGTDEIRHEDIGGSTRLKNPRQDLLISARVLELQANFRSRSQEFLTSAWHAATRAQSRMQWPYAKTKLNGKNLSLSKVGQVINMQGAKVFDDRAEDAAVIEFWLNSMLTDRDAEAVGTYIEEIELSSKMFDFGGPELDQSLQLDEEKLP
jgi:hypothetical protein